MIAKCFQCSAVIPEGQEVTVDSDSSPFVFCPRCAPAGSTPSPSPEQPVVMTSSETAAIATAPARAIPLPKLSIRNMNTETDDRPNMIGAVIVGLLAAALATAIWYGVVAYTHILSGFIAIGVGYVISLAVVAGSGWHRGIALQVLSIGLILISLAISEYLIAHHFINEAVVKQGEEQLPLLLPVGTMCEIIGLSLKETPLTLLFWGIALFEGFKIPSENADD